MELTTLEKEQSKEIHKKNLALNLTDFSIANSIIESDAFARLKNIRFLGAIDYLFKPNQHQKRHTRYEHSIDVAKLAVDSFYYLDLTETEKKHVIAAALLHDIGHAPLSHSLEPIFEREFGLNHHKATELIIKGQAPIGQDLKNVFKSENIDTEIVLALIDGDTSIKGHCLFSSKFNIDTLDGINRSKSYAFKKRVSPPARDILFASLRRNDEDKRRLDNFWHLKGQIYSLLIQGTKGLVADTVAKTIFSNSVSSDDRETFFWGEDRFMKKHHKILYALENISKPVEIISYFDNSTSETYYKNHFCIDEQYSHSTLESEKKRYKRKKEEKTFFIQCDDLNKVEPAKGYTQYYFKSKGLLYDGRIRKKETIF